MKENKRGARGCRKQAGGAESINKGNGLQAGATRAGLVKFDVGRLIRITPSQSDQGKGIRGP